MITDDEFNVLVREIFQLSVDDPEECLRRTESVQRSSVITCAARCQARLNQALRRAKTLLPGSSPGRPPDDAEFLDLIVAAIQERAAAVDPFDELFGEGLGMKFDFCATALEIHRPRSVQVALGGWTKLLYFMNTDRLSFHRREVDLAKVEAVKNTFFSYPDPIGSIFVMNTHTAVTCWAFASLESDSEQLIPGEIRFYADPDGATRFEVVG